MAELAGRLRLEIVGDFLPIVQAFGIMSAALAAYGHEFSDDEMHTIALAAEQIQVRTGREVPLDFDRAANLEPLP